MRVIFPNQKKDRFFRKCIFTLPWIVFFSTSIAPVLSFFLAKLWRIPGPQFFLGLSTYGIERSYFWQFLSYVLVSSYDTLFSTSLLIKNALVSLILYYGLKIIEINLGAKLLGVFLAINIVIVGICSWLLMMFTKNVTIFFGPFFLIISLINASMSFNAHQTLKLRIPSPPIKVKWLFLTGFGFILVYFIAARNFVNFGAAVIAFLTSTFFCVFLHIPHPFLSDLQLKEKIKSAKIKVVKKNKK